VKGGTARGTPNGRLTSFIHRYPHRVRDRSEHPPRVFILHPKENCRMKLKIILAIIATLYAQPALTAYIATLAAIGIAMWTHN